jgi:hypothetical protein
MSLVIPRDNRPRIESLPPAEAAMLIDDFAQARAAEVLASDTPDHQKAEAFTTVGGMAIDTLNRENMSDKDGGAVLQELTAASDLLERTPAEKRIGAARDPKFANAIIGLVFQVGNTPVETMQATVERHLAGQTAPQAASPATPSTAEARDTTRERLIDAIVEASGDSVQFRTDSPAGLILWGPAQHAESSNMSGGSLPEKICDTPWNTISTSRIVKQAAEATDPRDVPVEATAFTPAKQFVRGTTTEKKGLFGRTRHTQQSVNHYEDAMVTTPNGTERLIDVCYVFDPRLAGPDNAYAKAEENVYRHSPAPVQVPTYQSPFTSGGGSHRIGSHSYVRFAVPESFAETLYKSLVPSEDDESPTGVVNDQEAAPDPELIRDVIDKLAVKHGGEKVRSEAWYGSEKNPYPVRPPYEGLPAGWSIHVFDGMHDGAADLARAFSEFDKTYGHTAVTVR